MATAARRTTPSVTFFSFPVSFLLSATLLVAAATGESVKDACAKSPDPAFCAAFLASIPGSGTADARGLAELAIRAAATIGAAMGTAARLQLDVVTVKGPQWLCMDSCVAEVEEAVSHLDVDRGKATNAMEDAKFNDARDYIEAAEKDGQAWNCDLCRREGRPVPAVKTGLLPKGNEFEKVMGVTGALIKRVPGSAAPAPAPAPFSTRREI